MIYVTHDQVEALTLGDRIALMNRGALQQIGAPAEVYDEPKNTFVAGFLGTPPMNLLPGVWREASRETARTSEHHDNIEHPGDLKHCGDWAVECQGLWYSLPAEVTQKLARRPAAGAPIWLGLRPEDVEVISIGEESVILNSGILNSGAGNWVGRVSLVEALGDSTLVSVQPENERSAGEAPVTIVCRTASRVGWKVKDRVELRWNPQRVHLFDERGETLLRRMDS